MESGILNLPLMKPREDRMTLRGPKGIGYLRFILLVGLLWSMVGVGSLGAAPLAQKIDLGPIGPIALDGSGNGWAWAAPKPQTFATSFLLRIEDGNRYVAAT